MGKMSMWRLPNMAMTQIFPTDAIFFPVCVDQVMINAVEGVVTFGDLSNETGE
jgi:hypothetical protein